MGFYRLRAPAEAVRYARNINEAEVVELVHGVGGGSYSNARGPLELTDVKGRTDRVQLSPASGS